MNFGNFGFGDVLFALPFALLSFGLPLLLLVWFIRTVTMIATSLRDVADRLGALERTLRERQV